jgi:N-acetylneuraminic acid mutarotase
MHILDLLHFRWVNYEFSGEPPGPCNMHTADAYKDKIYVFRGGDGRDYLNDLHELNTSTLHWRNLSDIKGTRPPPRANHSSSIIKNNLYIFGGWDGTKRLNDLFSFDLVQFMWTQVQVVGESPAPRAGMEICNVNDQLYLFGGSGPHAFCFNDLYTFDTITSSWQHCNNFRSSNSSLQPKARAGHSMTLVDCKLYIIGGSYGQDYLKDVYILDIDPCPDLSQAQSESAASKPQDKLFRGLKEMVNKKDFSDITFLVEGQPFYGHKVIISQLSDKLRAMFGGGGADSLIPISEVQGFKE